MTDKVEYLLDLLGLKNIKRYSKVDSTKYNTLKRFLNTLFIVFLRINIVYLGNYIQVTASLLQKI